MLSEHNIKTSARHEYVDVTHEVQSAVRSAGAHEGICVVYCPHTTGAVTINEHADPDVVRDMAMALGKLVPHKWDYRHAEGNSDSHVQTSLVGPSQTLIISRGKLLLGRWQGIFFCEFDGPRERRFYVKVLDDRGGGERE